MNTDLTNTYLLIESRDPFDSADAANYCELAVKLAHGGARVRLFLVQNGVLTARRGADSGALSKAGQVGVEVLADEFSLRERGISGDALAEGVRSTPLETVVDALADGVKVIWH